MIFDVSRRFRDGGGGRVRQTQRDVPLPLLQRILDSVGEHLQAAAFTFPSARSTFLLGCIEFFYEPKPSQSPEPLEVPLCLFLPQSGQKGKKKKEALFHFVWKWRLAAAQIINRLC